MVAGCSRSMIHSAEIKYVVEATKMVTSLSAALADIALPDTDGREVRLGSLWETSRAVLVFLRHYG